jgi:hypothetical protein
METMELSVLERIVLSQILPTEGSFKNLKLIRVMREDLSFNEEENALLEFQETDGRLTWKEGVVGNKDVSFGGVIRALIVDALLDLDKKEELKTEHLTLYEKFIGDE